ncbi:hypothetical protein DVR12_05795 [Chitinophaga silvatica]|uniref:PNPLA domain-containing protein n=1 Tax=Chitinophaga silvatica TaxID=2282649 RepID=A0A3E1YDX8_9BACT|nr:patatin-like phospholipase family protein [Chitinophaga silvatica]RFS24711.1 hypothetical protein DVR12_05795 [Chitinophaga silvatica]
MQWKNWRSGLLSLKKVEDVLKQTLRSKTFEELKTPLYITATNFINGEQQVFESGPLIPAILAASSVPMLFPPTDIQGVEYVDGGLSSNLPVEPLLQQYKGIIGVHVNPLTPYNPTDGFLANLERTLHLAIREPVLKNRLLCSYFVEPTALGKFGMFEFGKLEAIYEVGLDYTRKLLEDNPL